jgi:hypothetical protein
MTAGGSIDQFIAVKDFNDGSVCLGELLRSLNNQGHGLI